MLQIDTFKISHLRNDEDFGYQQRVLGLAETLLVQEVDKAVVAAYKSAVDAFDAALKQAAKNSLTEAVSEADEAVDHLYTGLTLYLRSLTYHPTEAIRTAAETTLVIIDKYGTLTHLPYNQQYGALHNAMQELAAVPAETAETLQLGAWLTELESFTARFLEVRDRQTEEQSRYQVGLVKETRNAADDAYKQLTAAVNAFVIAFGEENYADFIQRVNVMVADIQAQLKARKTRAANAKEETTTQQ